MQYEGLSLQVDLVCEETKSAKTRCLQLQSDAYTFLDVKKAIERCFSIPVCVQSLLHQSNRVSDTDNLLACYVRDGDVLRVTYPVEGECERVVEVVEWLKKLEDSLNQIKRVSASQRTLYNTDGQGYFKYKKFVSGTYNEMAKDLSLNLVYPWSNRAKYVNKLHFDSLGGVKHLMSIYNTLVGARLSKVTLFRGHFLEMVCALFVANFTQTFPLRRRIIQHGGLDLSISTFLSAQVSRLGEIGSASDAIEVSLYAVCK